MSFRSLVFALFFCIAAQTAFAQFLPPVPVPVKPLVPVPIPVKPKNEIKENPEKEKAETKKEGEKGEEKEEKVEKINPLFERLVQPDRQLLRRFEQAERLANADRVAEAGQMLGSILEGSLDYLVPPPAEKSDRTTAETFDAMIAKKIRELPEAGRNSYSLQYETLARRLLTNAIQNGSLEGIQVVSQNYFPTAAGLDATFLLGMAQFEQGATGSAMFTLRKLQQKGVKIDAHEPTLSLTLTTCQLRLGMKDDAKKTAESLLQRYPNPSILLAGSEQWTPKTADEIVAKLEQSVGPPRAIDDWLERSGWLLSFGTPTQNPSTRTDRPLLELLWQIPMFGRADNASEARLLQAVVRRANEVYIPAAQPLVVNNRLIQRGMFETIAVDIRTGKRVWRSADADYRLPKSVPQGINQGRIYGRNTTSRFMLRILLWHDRIQQGLSSDGKRLYSIEGLELGPNMSFGNPWGGGFQRLNINGKPIEDPRPRAGNTLVARDVRTGQAVWRVGKFPYVQKVLDQIGAESGSNTKSKLPAAPDDQKPMPTKKSKEPKNEKDDTKESRPNFEASITEEERFLAETWFLGAPLPLLGRLNVIGENGGLLRLFVLDAQSGKLIRQQPLVQPPISFETDWLRRYYGLTPTSAKGILFCPTGLGMVVAVDATTGSPLWCFSYLTPPKNEDPNQRNLMRQQRYFSYGTSGRNEEFQNMFAQSGWQVPAMMVEGNRLIVAPPDVPAVYCIDIATGKPLWQKDNLKRSDALYVACIRNEKVYIVTPISMLALSLENGEPVWKYSLASSQTQKQGTVGRSALSSLRKRLKTSSDEISKYLNSEGGDGSGETGPPDLTFPKGTVPSGVGVHGDSKYYLPLSDGTVAVIDLDKGIYETVSPAQTFASSKPRPASDEIGKTTDPNGGVPIFSERLEIPGLSTAPALSSFRNDLTLGNLVGIHGMFFSQSPLRTTCFDQFEPLRKKAENLLQQNPDDPVGLMQLGRIFRAESNIPEAVAFFRRSLRTKQSETAASLLRETLLDALRTNYAAWSDSRAELESLSKLPEEFGEALIVLAQGAIRTGQVAEFLDALKKSFRLEADNPVRIPVEDGVNAQLSRAFGTIIEQNTRKSDEKLTVPLEGTASEIFKQLSDSPGMVADLTPLESSPWWEPVETKSFPPEIRRWRLFAEYFRTLPISKRATEILLALYEKNELYSSFESMLNPPVQWLVPGIDVSTSALNDVAQFPPPLSEPERAKSDSENSQRESTESNAVKTIGMVDEPDSGFFDGIPKKRKRSDVSLTETIALPSAGLPMSDILRLATLLESQDNGADAFYYYRQLNLFYGNRKIGDLTGSEIYRQAIGRPLLKKYVEREIVPQSWPTGHVEYPNVVPPKQSASADPSRQAPGGLLRAIRSRDRQVINRVVVPLVGSYEPFQSPYTYALETTTSNDFSLVCYDTLGAPRWRCDMSSVAQEIDRSGYFPDFYQQGFSFQNMYVKGCNHILLYIRNNTMIAIDTFRIDETGSPKVLWTKTLTSSQSVRQIAGALRIDNIQQGTYRHWSYLDSSDNATISDPVHLLPEVVCYKDADLIYGIDPVSGETLWTRDVPSFQCSILSDRNSLFLHLGETNQVVAIDPSSGKELANGTVPGGGFFVFETNIVCCSTASSGQYKLFICDLKDVFNQKSAKERALAVSYDTPDTVAAPSIKSHVVRENMTHDTTLKFALHNRFLATITRQEATLKLYDIQTKKDFFGEKRGMSDQRLGVKLKQLSSDRRFQHGNWDMDIEMVDDDFLVMFVENPNPDGGQKPIQLEDGKQKLRSCNNLNNVPSRPVGLGSLMLYDINGKSLWDQPVKIENWYRLVQIPNALPVALFGISVTEQEPNSQAEFSTALWGIDKRTGKTRFKLQVEAGKNKPNEMLQGFRVAADTEKYDISFIAPNRTFVVRFTDKEKPQEAEPPKEKPPAKPEPKKPVNPWFRLFAYTTLAF